MIWSTKRVQPRFRDLRFWIAAMLLANLLILPIIPLGSQSVGGRITTNTNLSLANVTLGSAGCYKFSSTSSPLGTVDTGICRDSAGVIDVGTGVAGNTSGTVKASTFTSTVAIGTAPFTVTSTTNVANLNASSLSGATFAAPGAIGGGTPAAGSFTTLTGTTLNTTTNCASTGGTCGSAPAGSVGITNPATTVTVATTAVTANSIIIVFEDSTLGTKLGATCNATLGRTYMVTTRTPATSFVITASATPAANTACLNYLVID